MKSRNMRIQPTNRPTARPQNAPCGGDTKTNTQEMHSVTLVSVCLCLEYDKHVFLQWLKNTLDKNSMGLNGTLWSYTTCLLISPPPETTHEEYDGDGGLEVGAYGLDVDKKLPTLTGLDNRNPEHRHYYQHQHKHPEVRKNKCLFLMKIMYQFRSEKIWHADHLIKENYRLWGV